MKREVERLMPRADRVASAVVVVVGLSVLMIFSLIHTLAPPITATIEHQVTMNQE